MRAGEKSRRRTRAKAAIAGERGMLREPAGDSGRRDMMAIPGRDFARGVFERVAAIIECQCFKDFWEGIGLVADCKGTSRERAPAGAAAVERNTLKLLLARAFFDEVSAVAVGTTLRRLN